MGNEAPQETETPFEKFRQFTKKIVSVPKSEIDRRERAYKKARKNKAKRHSL
jgi:hypothetical protein